MKNKTILLFSLTFLLSIHLAGQPADHPVYNEVKTINGPVQLVSSRISIAYSADEQVVESYVQAAVSYAEQTGIAAPVVIAIAIHESSFNSFLFTNTHNPFGILASKPWIGPTFSKIEAGKEIKYRVYDSAEAAVLDLGNFVQSRVWYADARSCGLDQYTCVIEGLMKTNLEPGFSMDPNWGQAVMGIIVKMELDQLDQ
ncbi:MAG: glucosaminidase domain-containing protein [Bacteroidota bacterium]|uniref:glucosaminidase domain-containing protein n=1 Tax=Runella sp. TaxID=1960881 RepID=UPI0030161E69